MINLKSVSCLGIAAIAGLGALAWAAPADAQVKILYNTYYSKKHPLMVGTVIPFKKKVEELTKGAVTVETPAATLAPPKKQWGMLTGGIADATTASISWIRKRISLTEIASLPFMALSGQGASVALWKTHEKFFASKHQYKQVHLLSFVCTSGSQLHNNKHAITKMEDFAGLKVRTSGSGVAVFKALGATPVNITGPKIFETFSKGVVDGVATPYIAVGAFKIVKYVKFTTDIPGSFYSTTFYVAMNKDKWNGLSAANKRAVEQASGEWLARTSGHAWDAGAGKVIKKMKASGVKIHHASPAFVEQIRKKISFVTDAWVKRAEKAGVDGRAAIAYYLEQAKANK